jgi:tetratricopeptide (TPR) repeat protein
MQKIQRNLSASYVAFGSGDTDLAIKSLVTAMFHRSNGDWTVSAKLRAYQNLAWFYFHQRRPMKALDCFLKVLHLQEQSFGPRSPRLANTLFNLAEIYRRLGHCERAANFYGRCLPIAIALLGKQHPCCVVINRLHREMLELSSGSDNRASSSSVHQRQGDFTLRTIQVRQVVD